MGMRLGRQGGLWISAQMIVTLIIVLIVVIVMVAMMVPTWNSGAQHTDKNACAQSVRISSHMKLAAVGTDLGEFFIDRFGNTAELECATEYLEIDEKEEVAAMRKLADSMVDCWQMYGEGDLEVFNTEDGSYCAICSRVEFTEVESLDGFNDFLAETIAPVEETTYLEYFRAASKRCGGTQLTAAQAAELFKDSMIDQDITHDVSEPLAIIYYMTKNAYPDGNLEAGKIEAGGWGLGIGVIAGVALCATVVGCGITGAAAVLTTVTVGGAAAAGTATGMALGASCTADYDAYLIVHPYDDIENLECTVLESDSTPLQIKRL